MRALLLFGNPWCFFILLLVIVLLLTAAALESRNRARTRSMSARTIPPIRVHEIAATAPLEALHALGERLADMQRHLPPDSDDGRWLASYLNDLRNVTDDVYQSLEQTGGAARASLLERLSIEVARLDHALTTRLSTTISHTTDRDALHAQLDQLRRSAGEP